MKSSHAFRSTMKFVIATPGPTIAGYASELHHAEELASQGRTRQIWRRNSNGLYTPITIQRSK